MSRILIVGGGVIGLSLAYELSKRSHTVTVLEKDQFGRHASWAGAGILPPTNAATAIHPLEQLESLSSQLHQQWAEELELATGIDTGFRTCGGWYIARTHGEKASLTGQLLMWAQRQIEYDICSTAERKSRLPMLQMPEDAMQVFVPGEFQFRNPHHLQALRIACQKNGVNLVEHVGAAELLVEDNRTQYAMAQGEKFYADQFCVAGGPWSEDLVRPFDVPLPSTPVRGQMVLFKLPAQIFSSVINEGIRFLVPRTDGHVLAGATIEEVGFNASPVAADVAALKDWANELMPVCDEQAFVKSWAGLRPATYDGFPYLGRIGNSPNSWVTTGHFKAGLHLSTGTAVVMADYIEGKPMSVDLTPFSPSRASGLSISASSNLLESSMRPMDADQWRMHSP